MDASRQAEAALPARIRLLPETLINRIAAGEVIERPAAAVKELVENALDAGAGRIAVSLAGGGIARIEVVDDGSGMDAEALALCVQRHATSKLSDDGLVRIATLGFRGEALPSIGAAARLALVSRPAGAAHAHAIRVEGGVVSPVAPSAGPPGTSAVVRDLFFATPARRAFLKHPRTEAGHAEEVVRRLALAAPRVAFRLESEGRVAFDLPGQDRAARVAALLGAEANLPIEAARDGLRLAGYAAPPGVSRASAAAQALVVNGRPVADPVLRTAVRVAYRDVIAAGRHAVLALFLELPAEAVDVNVHPAKAELRFRDPGLVRGFVITALQAVLGQGVRSPGPFGRRPGLRSPGLPPGLPPGLRPALHLVTAAPAALAEAQLPLAAPAPQTAPSSALPGGQPPDGSAHPLDAYPLGAAVAQLLETYIVAVAADGGLVLVDQHAAHERLTHETLRAQAGDGAVRSQPLLLPAVVELPASDAARLLARGAELAALGLELESFGPGALLVRALPAALGAPDPAPLLRDLADEFAEMEEATALAARLDAVLARMACHGSIRAGRRLNGPEMDALLRRMEATPRAATCSHGRPTVLKLGRAELERLFGRR